MMPQDYTGKIITLNKPLQPQASLNATLGEEDKEKQSLIGKVVTIKSPTQVGVTPQTPPVPVEDSIGDVWTRGLGGMYKGVSDLFNWMDNVGTDALITMGATESEIDRAKKLSFWDNLTNYFNKKAENQFAEALPPTGKYAQPIKNVWDFFDPKRIYKGIAENAPLMGTMMAATIANPSFGTAYIAGIEAGSAQRGIEEYERKTGERIPQALRTLVPVVVGSFNAALEKTGIEAILKGAGGMSTKKRLMAAAVGTLTEGVTEGIQDVNQVLGEATYTGKIDPEIGRTFLEAFHAGLSLGFGGSVVSGTFGAIGESAPVRERQEIRKAIESPEQKGTIVYHGTPVNFVKFPEGNKVLWFTPNESLARVFGENVYSTVIKEDEVFDPESDRGRDIIRDYLKDDATYREEKIINKPSLIRKLFYGVPIKSIEAENIYNKEVNLTLSSYETLESIIGKTEKTNAPISLLDYLADKGIKIVKADEILANLEGFKETTSYAFIAEEPTVNKVINKIDLYKQAIKSNNLSEATRLERELTNERLAHPVIQDDGSVKWEELSDEELVDIITRDKTPVTITEKRNVIEEVRNNIHTKFNSGERTVFVDNTYDEDGNVIETRRYKVRQNAKIKTFLEENLPFLKNEKYNTLYEAIKGFIPDNAFFQIINNDTAGWHGISYRNTGRIAINEFFMTTTENRVEVLLHEVIHNLTANILNRWEEGKKLNKLESEFAKDLQKLYNDVYLDRVLKDDYSKQRRPFYANVKEFLAYGLTLPEFQKILKNVKVEKEETAWTKFLTTIKKLFKLDKGDTALDRLFEITSNYLFKIETTEQEVVRESTKEEEFVKWAQTQINQHELLKDFIEQGRVKEDKIPTHNKGEDISSDILGTPNDTGEPVSYKKPKHIRWVTQRLWFPEFTLWRKGKERARRTSASFIEGELELNHVMRDYEAWYKKLMHGASKEIRNKTRQAMELAYQAKDPGSNLGARFRAEQQLAQLFAKYPVLEKAILGVDNRGGLIELFEYVKKRYQDTMRERKRTSLTDQENAIIDQLIEQERAPGIKETMFDRAVKIVQSTFNVEQETAAEHDRTTKGKTWDELPERAKIRKRNVYVKDRAAKLAKDADEVLSIDKWGLRDYISNIELGSYRIFDQEGNTVGFARTAREAKKRAFEMRKELREAGKPVPKYDIEATFSPIKPTAERGYWAIYDNEGKVVKELEKGIDTKKALAEFKEELRKKKKSSAGYTVQRIDVLKGLNDVFEILPRYIYAMEKRIIYEPLTDKYDRDKAQFPDEYTNDVQSIIQNQINYATGAKYSRGDMIVDDIVTSWGWQTGLYSKAIAKIRRGTALALLGYRPIASAINAMGGFGNTWVAVGNQFFMKAREAVKTGKYTDSRGNEIDVKRILKDLESRGALAIDFAVTAEGNINSRISLWHPLGLFQLPEKYIRPHNFVANYLYQVEHLGKDHFEAQEAALMNLRFQQAAYNIAAVPHILRSPGSRLVGQFKTYMINQIQFMSSLRGKQIARMVGLQLAMAGPRGVIYMLKTLPILGAIGLLDDFEDWFVRQKGVAGVAARGVGGLVGGDITAPATFQFPDRPEDWGGPFLSKGIQLFKKVIIPGLQSAVGKITGNAAPAYVGDEGWDWINSLSPMMYYVNDLLESVTSWESDVDVKGLESGARFVFDKLQKPNIWIRDSNGNKAYQIGGLQDRVLLVMGVTPIEKAKYKTMKSLWERNARIMADNRRKWYTKVVKKLIEGEAITDDLIQDGLTYKVDMNQIPDTYTFRQMSPQEREILRARIMDRAEAIDYWGIR